ncbi:uncharacterized protein TRUGW13939_06801 [Talaromyces rugulosus]|uniref:Rhodopsin domain-containing protein n=1 Tax=Talaromyces rugulosus TaxID=121627 RepID=A0A7H8R1X2_TALRU|nr:uncharacterized protein TRUGW13939_06801 [Talaromyces rugulosus]QKX59661.1 hypothetical protein TRUGW13939_06801 [Talaromyces rugulosus]
MSAENTADNPGRIVFVISWFLFCVLWLTVGTRMVTRWTLTRRFEGDDIVTWIALLLGSAQIAAVTVAVYNGLGQNIATLSASQISHFQQSLYASDILSVWTLGLSKIAVLLLLVQVTPIESHLRLAFGVGIFVLLWALSAFLVVAFECHLPHAWQFIGNQCVNRNLSIVTSCVPYLKPFYLGLESGLMQSNDPLRTNSRKFMSAYTYSDAYAYAYHRHKPDPIARESSGSNGKGPSPERDNTVDSDHDSVIELYDLSDYLDEGHADEDNLMTHS